MSDIHPPNVILPAPPATPPPPVQVKSPTLSYILTLLGMAMFVLIAIVAVTIIRPTQDNSSLYTIIVGFGVTTAASIGALIKSDSNGQKVEAVQITMNGRFSEWQNETRKATADAVQAAFLAGMERHRTNVARRATDMATAQADVAASALAKSDADAAKLHAEEMAARIAGIKTSDTVPETINIQAENVNVEGQTIQKPYTPPTPP